MNEQSLAGAKFRAPALVEWVIDRRRLSDPVEVALRAGKATVLQAVAGYGKTTLAAQVAENWAGRVVWVSLDPRDSGLDRLWNLLRAAATGEPVGQLGLDDARREALTAIDVGPRNSLLVVDDVHHLNDEAQHGLLRAVERVRGSVGVILTARPTATLPLDRLRAAGGVFELDPARLAFDEQEADALCAVKGGQGTLALAATAGWPAVMHLWLADPASASADRASPLSRDLVGDYISSQVLGSLDSVSIGALLRASLFEKWSLEMLGHVVKRPVDDLAVRCRRLTPVVAESPKDTDGAAEAAWLCLNPALAAHLDRLRPQRLAPEEANDCRHAAAAWFESKRMPEQAFDALVAAGAPEAAARVLTSFAVRFEVEHRQGDVRERFERLPRSLRLDPALSIGFGWAALATGGANDALEWCTRVERLHQLPSSLKLSIATLRSFAHRVAWQLDEAVEHAESVLDMVGDRPAPDEAGAAAMALAQLADIDFWKGRFETVRQRFEVARQMIDVGGHRLSRTKYPAQRAVGLARAGYLHEAENWADEAHRVAEATGLVDTDVDAEADLARALAAIEACEYEGAVELLERVIERSARGNFGTTHVAATLDLAWLLLDSDPERARVVAVDTIEPMRIKDPHLLARMAAFAAGYRVRIGDEAAFRSTLEYFTTLGVQHADSELHIARAALELGDVGCALRFLPDESACALAGPRYVVARTLLAARCGADEDLAKAFDFAFGVGLEREVLVNSAPLAAMRESGALSGVQPSFVRRLEGLASSWQPAVSVLEGLSERELEVLPMLASRATLPEIAAGLYISENTLKTHLRNIYRKLGLSSRREAAEFAEAHCRAGIARSG